MHDHSYARQNINPERIQHEHSPARNRSTIATTTLSNTLIQQKSGEVARREEGRGGVRVALLRDRRFRKRGGKRKRGNRGKNLERREGPHNLCWAFFLSYLASNLSSVSPSLASNNFHVVGLDSTSLPTTQRLHVVLL